MPASAKAFICGVAGTRLTDEERRFLADERPFGLILFRRNCPDPESVRDLTAAFRDAVGRSGALVLVDQEGGRVQRLGPPHWPSYAAARLLGALAERDPGSGRRAAWLHGRLIAADLRDVGIDVTCAPVLDVATPGGNDAIGDRAFAGDPLLVAALGRAFADGLLAGGVLPVMKHIPGQGRATLDSHLALPVVEAEVSDMADTDFAPFDALADLPIAMTAHVVYAGVDPAHPATTSAMVIRDIIRGRIKFDGLLVSDDISMHALTGDYGDRATAIYAAGCDLVLHCNARIEEMRAVAATAGALAGKSGERASRAVAFRQPPQPFDHEAGREEYRATLARVDGRLPS